VFAAKRTANHTYKHIVIRTITQRRQTALMLTKKRKWQWK